MINDYYLSELDLSLLRDFVLSNGVRRTYGKGEYLVCQGERRPLVGLITDGLFRHIHTDALGRERTIGFSLPHEFVGEYTGCLCGREAMVGIQSLRRSEVYVVRYEALARQWKSSMEWQRLGRLVAEQLFVMTYKRLLDSYCTTPEERYMDLMRHYPQLKELLPLREIASFIGVTPETVSKIRRKLLDGKIS